MFWFRFKTVRNKSRKRKKLGCLILSQVCLAFLNSYSSLNEWHWGHPNLLFLQIRDKLDKSSLLRSLWGRSPRCLQSIYPNPLLNQQLRGYSAPRPDAPSGLLMWARRTWKRKSESQYLRAHFQQKLIWNHMLISHFLCKNMNLLHYLSLSPTSQLSRALPRPTHPLSHQGVGAAGAAGALALTRPRRDPLLC